MLAAERGGCVSLGQGVPSFATPQHIIDAVTKVLNSDPGSGQYSLQSGMVALRSCIAEYLFTHKNIEIDPAEEICVTVGGMEGLLATILTVVDTGDEVLLPSPTYASYTEQILLAGGIPRQVPLNSEWGLDIDAISNNVTPKTRALLLCNPGNPTGNVFSDKEITTLCQLALANDFVLITDEAYDYIIYDGDTPVSPLSIPSFRNHVISISSLSKKYALTGWRVGWVTASQPWMEQIMKVHDAATICSPTPSQFAALAALEGDQECVASMCRELEKRKTLCCSRLDRLSEHFSYVPPKGAFYIMAKYLFSSASSDTVAVRLLKEAGVVTIPGGSYGLGGEGHLRLSFGGEEETINTAFDRIEKWLSPQA